ncbi:MAG: hypothetical protein HGA85_05475 [Nanoarchaeota archaeon]|nr:hypothetical protein [Nanoarchaeota archaeon]
MKDAMENAKEELKRIDHLIYVTLKYTRTVDVFLSVIDRMINSYEFTIDALVKLLVSEHKLAEEPDIPLAKAQAVLEHYDSKKVKENIDKYLLLRKLKRANYEKSNEFRRHVTMTAIVEGKVIQVNIDNITEDFHALKEFIDFVEKKISA